MGALLAGALIIIPAATGRRLANSIGLFLLASSLVSLLAVGLGFLVNTYVLRGLSLAAHDCHGFSSHFLPELDQAEGLARESALVQSGRKA